jgi:hypothetical protein
VGGGHTRGRWATGGPPAPRRGSARRRPPKNTWAPGLPPAGAASQGLRGRGGAAGVRGEGDERASGGARACACEVGGDRIKLGGRSLVFVLVHKEGRVVQSFCIHIM